MDISVMRLKLLYLLWRKYRFVPKRIYSHGTIGLKYFDDRTWLEKICDYIDEMVKPVRKIKRDTNVWHTFTDTSTGEVISSYSQMKDLEKKKGISYMTFREAEEHAKRNKKHIAEQSRIDNRKALEKKYRELKQGKKFSQELYRKYGINKFLNK